MFMLTLDAGGVATIPGHDFSQTSHKIIFKTVNL